MQSKNANASDTLAHELKDWYYHHSEMSNTVIGHCGGQEKHILFLNREDLVLGLQNIPPPPTSPRDISKFQ